MATILLSTVAGSVASNIGLGAFGTAVLQGALGTVGKFVDSSLMGGSRRSEGPRLSDLAVQTSTYGRMIPVVYGTVRIAGNIIWARPIKEEATTTTSSAGGGKGVGGGKASQSSTSYSYYATLAIAICEGRIDEILRVWADSKQLDISLGTYRLYKGGEGQLADPLIESFEGVGHTPAYRGMAYVVLEDFPLADFGNRIPNFTFEVKKKLLTPDVAGDSVENLIESVIMIPGSGEFVYDTVIQKKIGGEEVAGEWAQQGEQSRINMHNTKGKANALLSLDQLQETCPNVEWVGVVATWFGSSLDAGACTIKPGVEYKTGATTAPEIWTVAGFNRASAIQITLIDDSPRYGGTPDDQSLLRYLDALQARGLKVMFYPMFFMDVDGKPWRGHVTGSASDVASFFTKTNGYNTFVTHYANLVKDKVDAFVIGSELKGLTKVTDTPGNYPAVNALVSLAATVKGIVGSGVKVTYAADWSEYHHTDGGWYNLDPLWASPNIDMVGIDAYFPLTNAPQNDYDIQAVMDGWTSGEGYDFYYSDPERTVEAPLGAAYAWKNIEWWWKNSHTNPDSSSTGWVPESKKIWFTEYGFPSVDGATNQPNVFYDPNSVDSFFPYHSRGRIDFRAQRTGLAATEAKWKNSTMIERKFVWTWDARPFPYWPDLRAVWADGPQWQYGHWVQGKLGVSGLAAIVANLCQRVGLAPADVDVSRLRELVEGYVITAQQTARASIEQLMTGYFFDAVESDNIIKFIPRGGEAALTISGDALVPVRDGDMRELLTITRLQEVELPQRVNVIYINRTANYQPGTQISQRAVTGSREAATISLPIVFADQTAKIIGDVSLFNSWMARTLYEAHLPVQYAALEPTDIIEVDMGEAFHTIRITATQRGAGGVMRVRGVAEDVSTYDFYSPPGQQLSTTTEGAPIPATFFAALDIPALPTDRADKGVVRFAAAGTDATWRGGILYRSDDDGGNYSRLVDMNSAATIGTALDALADFTLGNIIDESSRVTVAVVGTNLLSSLSPLALLNGGNAALLGNELIQFGNAELLAPGKYRLSNLLRGRLGTEWAMPGHAAGEWFVLLDSHVTKEVVGDNIIGLPRLYKPVTIGATLGSTDAVNFTYSGLALRPYAPVHIVGERDGGSNLIIHWQRRTRLGGDWRDYADVPLNEQNESYEVEIMDGADVVRTFSGISSPTASYSAAEQVADFGSPQPVLSVRIYQLSAVIGRGYAGEAVI